MRRQAAAAARAALLACLLHRGGAGVSWLDCTGSQHGEWAALRVAFAAAAPSGGGAGAGLPSFDEGLWAEAARLHNKHMGYLARGNEDYPGGAASLYHGCHWGEESAYCLYGHVAALAYLARYAASGAMRHDLTRAALRLLHWNLCLDFLESSSWGFSLLDLWDNANGFVYPSVTLFIQTLEFGPGVAPPDGSPRPAGEEEPRLGPGEKPSFTIFELGTHRALSNEPLSMFRRLLPDYEVVHWNFMKPYEGRAEVYNHPFPRSCSPNCRDQQDSVPYTFPVFDGLDESKHGFQLFIRPLLRKPAVKRASVFLCTNPIYLCDVFTGFNRTVVGYFGLPLLYMVPKEKWDAWIRTFVSIASSPDSIFVANNALLSQQILWQSGLLLGSVRPEALYLEHAYNPTRLRDILVPEPREACVLNCMLRALMPEGFGFSLFAKKDTDRTFRTFSTFRAVVIFPHDVALMSFYEFYSMAMPLFLPAHLSKYIFPYSASVPLLDWVPKWVSAARGEDAGSSPLSLTTVDALAHWSRLMDFFVLPAVQLFPSLAGLFAALSSADFDGISAEMRRHRAKSLPEAAAFWSRAAAQALAAR